MTDPTPILTADDPLILDPPHYAERLAASHEALRARIEELEPRAQGQFAAITRAELAERRIEELEGALAAIVQAHDNDTRFRVEDDLAVAIGRARAVLAAVPDPTETP